MGIGKKVQVTCLARNKSKFFPCLVEKLQQQSTLVDPVVNFQRFIINESGSSNTFYVLLVRRDDLSASFFIGTQKRKNK